MNINTLFTLRQLRGYKELAWLQRFKLATPGKNSEAGDPTNFPNFSWRMSDLSKNDPQESSGFFLGWRNHLRLFWANAKIYQVPNPVLYSIH